MARRFVYFQGARPKKRPIVFWGDSDSFSNSANYNPTARQFLQEIMAPMPANVLVPTARASVTDPPLNAAGATDTRFWPYWPFAYRYITELLDQLEIPWEVADLATGEGYWFLPPLDPGDLGLHPSQAALTSAEQANLIAQATIHGAILGGDQEQWTTPGGSNDRYITLFTDWGNGSTQDGGNEAISVAQHDTQPITPGITIRGNASSVIRPGRVAANRVLAIDMGQPQIVDLRP